MRKLYYGCVSVQKGSELYNETAYGLCVSENEFTGSLIAVAKRKYPNTPISNVYAYEIPEATIREAFKELEG